MDPFRFKINEIFSTVQGEGYWTGVPSTFIRLQGCAVGCPWCDTKYTWHGGGEWMTVDDILPHIQHKHVVITGGEPTYWDLSELIVGINQFTNYTAFIQMESSGHKPLKTRPVIDWITWSPKRAIDFEADAGFRLLVDEIKFVVDAELSFEDVEEVLNKMKELQRPMVSVLTFMGEGCPPTPDSLMKAIEFAKEFDGAVKTVMVSDRLQYRAGVK